MFTTKLMRFSLFVPILLFWACSHTAQLQDGKYSFYILAKDGREYLVQSARLDSGIIVPEIQGVELDGRDMDRDIIVKDGFYYHLSRKNPNFSKFRLDKGKLALLAGVQLKDFSIEQFKWLGGDTILLIGLNIKGANQPKYALVKTGAMSLLTQGELEIPKPEGKYTSMSIGLIERRAEKLLVAYTYHVAVGTNNYSTSDTMYVSTLTYPGLKLLDTEKDGRSTYPGGINTIQSYDFTDEKQDDYFMSCPGIALGNRPELPTAIFRIKAGQTQVDRSYFFDISGSVIQNHAYGLWYLGHGKALVRSERKDLFKGLADHYSTAHFEFYVIDLQSKAISKLPLPLDKGTRRECVIVAGQTAYIAVNSTKEGNYVWVYDLKTGGLKKGLQLGGDTDFILRIDQIKN